MKLRFFILLCAVVFHLFAPALASSAETEAPVADDSISLDFKDIDLPDFIKTISEFTGKNFIFDETVRGKVTIISPKRVTPEEAYQIFLSVLNVKGYTVVPSGSVNKIVSLVAARESNLPMVRDSRGLERGEQYVTYLLPLQNIDVNDIATSVLAALVPKTGSIFAFQPTNTLIITDSAANIERLVKILKQLDVSDGNEAFEVIELHYVAADEMAKLVAQVMNDANAPMVRRRGSAKVQTVPEQNAGKIIPFNPTNVLVLRASTEEIESIKSIVAKLDQKPSQNRAGIHVYYLENADAETLAKTMNEILTGIKSNPGAVPGRPVARGAATPAPQELGGVSITADKPTNSLIINSTPEEYATVRDIIQQLDIKRKQVYVEALILELSMDATKKLGTSLAGAVNTSSDGAVLARTGLNTDNLTATSIEDLTNPLAKAVNGILLGGIFNPITIDGPDGKTITVPALSVLIDLSKNDTDINILSAPRLLTSDNEEAEIVVGSNVPIITSRLTNAVGAASADNSGLATSVAVERKDVALTLRFTPQITEGDLVRLNVYQEITNIADSNSNVGDPSQVGPSFTKRLIRNTVLAENGRTVVLGGLIDSNVQQRISKVPVLGDIPMLGWLFKSKSSTEHKTNLLVFITPHIIKDSSDLSEVTNKAQDAMHRFQQDQNMPSEVANKALEQRLEGQPVNK